MGRGSTYQKRQDGNATVFETTPAKAPISLFMLILGLFCAGAALREEGIGIMYSIFAVICLVVAFRDPRPKPHRKAATFRVSPDGVQVGSDTWRASDIRGWRMENLYNQEFGKGLLSWIANTRTQSMRRAAYFLGVQMGGTSQLVAGGLDEATANGLLNEVNAILGPRTA